MYFLFIGFLLAILHRFRTNQHDCFRSYFLLPFHFYVFATSNFGKSILRVFLVGFSKLPSKDRWLNPTTSSLEPAWRTCQKRAKFSFYVPTCQKVCYCFNLTCQHAKWRANFSTWHAIVPEGVPFFQTVFLGNAKENFYTLSLYKKLYILVDTIVIHIICICIINKNCIILYFYTSCHTKEKCVEFFFFIMFFLFCPLVRN